MNGPDTTGETREPVTHILVRELLAAVAGGGEGCRVLLIGIGSGRHIPPMLAEGVSVDALEDDPARARAAERHFMGQSRVRIACGPYPGPIPFPSGFCGALSTNALLHGNPAAIRSAVAAVRCRLAPGAPFFATLGSTRDPRFGKGRRLDAATFAPLAGSESGVPHAYFDEAGVRSIFTGFALELLAAEAATTNVGSWAHTPQEAAEIVHWFVRGRRTSN